MQWNLAHSSLIVFAALAAIDAGTTRIKAGSNVSWMDRGLVCHSKRWSAHEEFLGTRPTWREPAFRDLCCTRGCFRGVFDGRVDLESYYGTADALSDGERLIALIEKIKRVLVSEFELDGASIAISFENEWRLGHDGPKYFTAEQDAGRADWTELHADYYESEDYVFTAILYLGEEEHDDVQLIGGETGIVNTADDGSSPGLERSADATLPAGWTRHTDAASGNAYYHNAASDATQWDRPTAADGVVRLVDGIVVEPAKGRLLLFSADGANYHAPMPVVQGRRSALHVWFRCNCTGTSEGDGGQSAEGTASHSGL